jgi:hypothetical protein
VDTPKNVYWTRIGDGTWLPFVSKGTVEMEACVNCLVVMCCTKSSECPRFMEEWDMQIKIVGNLLTTRKRKKAQI